MSDTRPPRHPPGLFSRLIVVVFGAAMLLLAQALVRTGGVVGVVLGLVTALAGLAIVAIGAGVVEWWSQRRHG